MTDEPKQEAPQAGFALAADLKSVLLKFPLEGGQHVAVALASVDMPQYLANLAGLVDFLRMKGVVPAVVKQPQALLAKAMRVGTPALPGYEKFTAINFNAGQSDEAMWLLDDELALGLADGIEQKVFHGMSIEQQQAMIKRVEGKRNKARIILPPVRNGRPH